MLRTCQFHRLAFIALSVLGISNLAASQAQAGANPKLANYGYGEIVATPHYPIVGQTATIQVRISNDGDAPATNVQVKVSFNDWGVTFQGWQQIGSVQTIASIPAGGTATVTVTNVFQNKTHTCLEALIVGADQDTDPNDDRGQINLEVINAGDSFGYDVPVGNNGNHPVNLVLEGQAAGGANGVAVPVKLDKRNLALAPGEEKPVHVEVDLSGVPPGSAPILVKIVAFDSAATGPENQNNVIFEIHVTTAYQLKGTALARLQALQANMPNKPLKNRMGVAIQAIKNARNLRFWNGENRLKKPGGAAVFAQEAAAVLALGTLMKTELPLAMKAEADAIIRMLTDADRILAETAVNDAGKPAKAVQIKNGGDNHRRDGEYTDAIKDYAHAWGVAMKL